MVDELHKMGFKVMLWVVPYVSTDGLSFIKHYGPHAPEDKEYFLRTESGEVAIVYWWNGYSAILDFTKECDRNYLDEQLHALMSDFGIDGFKFDGGTLSYYRKDYPINGAVRGDFTAAERNIAWNEFGTRYKFHEYKDTFKGGGKRSIQRIRDRGHLWEGDGLSTLIPNAIAQGLLGHPFVCPDMVGGGEWTYRENNIPVDQELFVRMAQCSALFPMMQFSWAPWEAVDTEHLNLIRRAHDLHNAFSDKILALVKDAHENGEPILRPLEYNYPHSGYERVHDTFMLGEDILVAPIIVKGQREREVPLPEGRWLGFDGKEYVGGKTVKITVTLADLPYFERIK
jgi:alpha-glucosidase